MGNYKTSEVKIIYGVCGVMYTADMCVVNYDPDFGLFLTQLIRIDFVIDQLIAKIFFNNKFIIFLYMFRALLCSSSGGQNCIVQHLVSSHL